MVPNAKLAPLVLLVFLGQTSSVTTSSIPWLWPSLFPFVAFCPILSPASWSWLNLTLVSPFNAMPSWENVDEAQKCISQLAAQHVLAKFVEPPYRCVPTGSSGGGGSSSSSSSSSTKRN